MLLLLAASTWIWSAMTRAAALPHNNQLLHRRSVMRRRCLGLGERRARCRPGRRERGRALFISWPLLLALIEVIAGTEIASYPLMLLLLRWWPRRVRRSGGNRCKLSRRGSRRFMGAVNIVAVMSSSLRLVLRVLLLLLLIWFSLLLLQRCSAKSEGSILLLRIVIMLI